MQKIRRKGAVPVMEQRELDGMEYLVFPALEETGMVRHMFGTRVGGVSEGKYATVNFSYTLGDRRECVDENYRRAARILTRDGDIGRFVVGRQTHTTNVRVVTEEDRGKGVTREQDYQDVDALITNVPGLVLTTFHADCPPVYIVDPVHRAIGLAHSGWKGTIGEISRCTLERMAEVYGTRAEDCICAIGPSICQDCYEVSSDVADRFREQYRDRIRDFDILQPGQKPGKYQLGLWKAIRMVLLDCGVLPEHISVTDICTRCNCGYLYSHRITGFERGNMAAFLSIAD